MAIEQDVRELLGTLAQLGINEEFIAEARARLDANPDDLGEWVELAIALRENQAYDAAVAAYQTAIQRFPDSHMLYSNRGRLFLEWELYEQALQDLSRAIDLKPDYLHAIGLKAATHERLHEFNKAKVLYERVLDIEPGHAMAWNSLGVCLLQLGDEDEAIRCFGESLKADRNFVDPVFNLAGVYYDRKDWAKAEQHASHVLELEPDDRAAANLLKTIRNRL